MVSTGGSEADGGGGGGGGGGGVGETVAEGDPKLSIMVELIGSLDGVRRTDEGRGSKVGVGSSKGVLVKGTNGFDSSTLPLDRSIEDTPTLGVLLRRMETAGVGDRKIAVVEGIDEGVGTKTGKQNK